jgi:hypothetical protein
VFAKLDVTFGGDIEGVGGKAGMRVSGWTLKSAHGTKQTLKRCS